MDTKLRGLAVFLLLPVFLVLSACADTGGVARPGTSVNTRATGGLYRIRPGETTGLQYRMLDSVNALRTAAGAAALQLDPRLNAAAATHSRDMSLQNRPWHFGSDGSSPIDRVRRVGYTGQLVGENISETFETELETLAAWMQDPNTRRVILDPAANQMGFAWLQEANGKIWWTLITARGAGAMPAS